MSIKKRKLRVGKYSITQDEMLFLIQEKNRDVLLEIKKNQVAFKKKVANKKTFYRCNFS